MPSMTGLTRTPVPMPASDTPALAKPNTGRTTNATHGCSMFSSRCNGEATESGWPGERSSGIVRANSTPATVAWMPDLSTAYQSSRPSGA